MMGRFRLGPQFLTNSSGRSFTLLEIAIKLVIQAVRDRPLRAD
jgi:hypothetical protein